MPFSRGGSNVLNDLCVSPRTPRASGRQDPAPVLRRPLDDAAGTAARAPPLDVSDSGDVLIAMRTPSYLLRHPRKVVWFTITIARPMTFGDLRIKMVRTHPKRRHCAGRSDRPTILVYARPKDSLPSPKPLRGAYTNSISSTLMCCTRRSQRVRRSPSGTMGTTYSARPESRPLSASSCLLMRWHMYVPASDSSSRALPRHLSTCWHLNVLSSDSGRRPSRAATWLHQRA